MTTLITPGVCRVCGCSAAFACDGGCAWVDPTRTLCSRCADANTGLTIAAGLHQMAAILQASGGSVGGLRLVEPSPPTTYRIHRGGERDAIQCLRCGSLSHHPHDVAERYCARCKLFHEP